MVPDKSRKRRTPFRRLPADRRREEVVAAAVEVFGRRPEQELSIDDVALAAGTSRASVYRCFDSKHDLYVATMRELGARLAGALAGDLAAAPADRLADGLRRYFDFVAAHRAGYAALLRLGAPGGQEDGGGAGAELRRLTYAWVYRVLEVPAPGPLLETAVAAWVAGLERTGLEWSAERGPPRADVEALLAVQLVLTLVAVPAFELPADPG